MSRHYWSEPELQVLREIYADLHTDDVAALLEVLPRQVYAAASRLGLRKSEEFNASAAAGRIQRGRSDPRMVASQFRPGLVPWNKGTNFRAGGRSAETRFKPGHKPVTTAPVGSYRIDGQGLLQRKVGEEPGCNSRRWRGVHELVWIAANGPVPAGHIVVFKPGQRTAVLEEINRYALSQEWDDAEREDIAQAIRLLRCRGYVVRRTA